MYYANNSQAIGRSVIFAAGEISCQTYVSMFTRFTAIFHEQKGTLFIRIVPFRVNSSRT